MELIESKTATSSQASIEFVSIPQSFTDLVILISGRSTRAGEVRDEFQIRFNSNTANYSGRFLQGGGSGTPVTGTGNGTAAFTRVEATAAGATSNTFSNATVYIANYTGSTFKSITADMVTENNATEAYQKLVVGLWSDTSAITSILVFPEVGQIAAGTIISLYGILKGSDGIVTTS
jgi:hypothetical protein